MTHLQSGGNASIKRREMVCHLSGFRYRFAQSLSEMFEMTVSPLSDVMWQKACFPDPSQVFLRSTAVDVVNFGRFSSCTRCHCTVTVFAESSFLSVWEFSIFCPSCAWRCFLLLFLTLFGMAWVDEGADQHFRYDKRVKISQSAPSSTHATPCHLICEWGGSLRCSFAKFAFFKSPKIPRHATVKYLCDIWECFQSKCILISCIFYFYFSLHNFKVNGNSWLPHTNILLSVKELVQLHTDCDCWLYVAFILIFVPFVFCFFGLHKYDI